METMKVLAWSALIVCVSLGTALSAAAQTPVGALAIDERQGDQYGWAVDYETASAAQERALRECGSGCSVVLMFGRCAAYAADQDADSTAVGWAESFDSAAGARQAALSECGSRGGARCTVRVWGCNGPVVEEGLGLNHAARQQVQQGLQAEGFAPGGVDGLFGPRTRAAIRNWQSARGVRSTGYLDGPQVDALRSRGGSAPPASVGTAVADSGGLELAFWQSIQNSTNPADFEAYLRRFPNGVFSELAQNRLSALGAAAPGADPASRVRPDETCAGQAAGVACWMEISQRPGCYVWNPFPQPGETVTWTGACAGGKAQGTGTLTWVYDGGVETGTGGRLVDGKFNGHWVMRNEDGSVSEGPYVDDERNGYWVTRLANGAVEEGPYVNGVRHGRWIWRSADGDDIVESLYEEGEEREMNFLKIGGEDVR